MAPFSIRAGQTDLSSSPVIEIVPQGQRHHAQQSVSAFLPSMIEGHGTRHNAQTQRADGRWHHEAMLHGSLPKRHCPQQDSEHESNLMEERILKNPASRRKNAKQHCRANAMRDAHARQRNRDAIDAAV